MTILRRFLALVLLVLFFTFCAFNTAPVTLRFPGWSGAELPLFLPILAAFFAGIVIALLGQSLYTIGRRLGDRHRNHAPKAAPSPTVQPASTDDATAAGDGDQPDGESH